jgi:hypothetical protein
MMFDFLDCRRDRSTPWHAAGRWNRILRFFAAAAGSRGMAGLHITIGGGDFKQVARTQEGL